MINPDRWRQVQDIYVDAMQMEPLKRTPFLEKVCGADVYMRREVESLLECENKVGKFLEQTAIEVLVRMYGPEVSEEQPDTAGDLIGCVIDDRYIVREYIGSGGMGDVYRADHRLLGMPVAIKRLSRDLRDRKEFRQRFIEEARRTVLLDHENVSRVKDVVEESDEVFVVMEFIDGQTLRTRLGQPFELDEFLDIAVQCASALAAAHRERIVHLDIKPDNIMLTASQKVKVCDFGVAHQLPLAESPIAEAAPRWVFAGTPAYMAPEVIESNHFDARADIFSIGVVFYEMLAGEHPFRSDNVRATTKRIVNEPAPSLRLVNKRLPARLIHLIDRMLAKDPEQRMDSAELVRELQSIRSRQRFLRDAWHAGATQVGRRPVAASVLFLAALLAVVPIILAPNVFNRLIGWGDSVSAPRELVVIPFRNVGDDPANQAFCDGLTEILSTKLSQFERFRNAFRVVPAIDVLREKITGVREAQQFFGGATLVVTGSVQRINNRIRLTVNLIDARADRLLGAYGPINAELEDLAAAQDSVVLKVAELLNATLPQNAEQLLEMGDPAIPAAYDFYVQGRGYLQHYEDARNVDSAIELFGRALSMDVKYALAHAALGEAYWRKYELTKEPRFADLGKESCQKALQLNLQLAPLYVTLALIGNGRGRYEDAIQDTRRALAINPVDAGAYRELAKAYQGLGKLAEAEATYRQAIAARPSDWGNHSFLGFFYFQHARYQEAEAQFRHVVVLAPDNVRGYNNLGAVYQSMQQYSEAETVLKKSLSIRPTAAAYSNLGTIYYYQLQRPNDAAKMFEQAAKIEPQSYRWWLNLASAYYWSPGERDKARMAFEKAIELAERDRQTNPRSQTLLVSLADCYAMIGESGRALDYLTQAMNVAPLDANLMANVGEIYEQLGQRALALEWIGRALRGGYSRDRIDRSLSLSQLRSDPTFQTLQKP